MTAPNIAMIAASLQSCSLGRRSARGGGGGLSSSPPPPPPLIDDHKDESEGVTLELNPDAPLPYPWEQCLDIRTGEVYYINWMNGTRTDEDPRTFTAYHPFSYFSDDGDGDGGDSSSEEEDAGWGDEGDAASCSSGLSSTSSSDTSGPAAKPAASCSSGLSSSSSSATSGPATEPSATLVAAGCRGCFMYFMVPKRVVACPRCAGDLLHLGRNGFS